MTDAKEELQRCYVLIAEWFAIALGCEKDKQQFREGPFYPVGRPHTFAIIVLSNLGVTKRLSEKYEFEFVSKREDLARRVLENYDRANSFSEVLETFIELAIYYGTAETRKDKTFEVHKDVEHLFVELEKLGFAKRSELGFQWTGKLDPIMRRICNYDFFEDAKATSGDSGNRRKDPFRYL